MGTTIELTASDGHRLAAYRADPAGNPRGGLVVIQEIFGVNSHIRSVADGYARDGYLVIAPALFDRAERGFEVGYTPPEIERGRAVRAKVSLDDALKDVAAAIKAAASAGKVGIVGYCWGGTVAWAAATRLDGLAASSPHYGGGIAEIATERPRVPVMFHFGETDQQIPMTDVEKIRKAQAAQTVHVYAAGHGFNCDQRGSYDDAAAERARERTLAFLRQHVG
jgi:carboxymethylenebutenolidase